MRTRSAWKASRDPLYRGAFSSTPGDPVPGADPSIVRHILYLEGFGRATPYLSASEEHDSAAFFAKNHDGAVWETAVPRLTPEGIAHRSRKELLQLLKGKGKGDAAWHSAHQVMRAAVYVEEHLEHLLDFRKVNAAGAAQRVFKRVR